MRNIVVYFDGFPLHQALPPSHPLHKSQWLQRFIEPFLSTQVMAQPMLFNLIWGKIQRKGRKVMETILIIILVLFVLGGGGFYWTRRGR